MASASDLAKRALVTLIRLLAGIHCITTDVKRDSPVEGVRQAYRALSRKVHPDRGGKGEDQQKLTDWTTSVHQAKREERAENQQKRKIRGCRLMLPLSGQSANQTKGPGRLNPRCAFFLGALARGQHSDGPQRRSNSSSGIQTVIFLNFLSRCRPSRGLS
jgi:hypothetical protein